MGRVSTLAAAQAGDEHAFEQLVAAHRRELGVHCYRMLGSLEDAEEALQETMLAASVGDRAERVVRELRWAYQPKPGAPPPLIRILERVGRR